MGTSMPFPPHCSLQELRSLRESPRTSQASFLESPLCMSVPAECLEASEEEAVPRLGSGASGAPLPSEIALQGFCSAPF